MNRLLIHRLSLKGFDLEFEIDVAESVARTRAYKPPGVDNFVSVVASIYVSTQGKRLIVGSAEENGNLIVLIDLLLEAARNPFSNGDIERIVSANSISSWMHGYWRRISEDAATDDDERIYDSVIPACLVAESGGYIAFYRFREQPTLEVSSQGKADADCYIVSAAIDSSQLTQDILRLKSAIVEDLMNRIREH